MRKTFDADKDIPLPPHGHMPIETRLSCSFCGLPTLRDALVHHGARCLRCYDAYCAQMPQDIRVPAEAIPSDAGKLDWAFRLRWRHQQGDRLTLAQVDCYRTAVKRYEGRHQEPA